MHDKLWLWWLCKHMIVIQNMSVWFWSVKWHMKLQLWICAAWFLLRQFCELWTTNMAGVSSIFEYLTILGLPPTKIPCVEKVRSAFRKKALDNMLGNLASDLGNPWVTGQDCFDDEVRERINLTFRQECRYFLFVGVVLSDIWAVQKWNI